MLGSYQDSLAVRGSDGEIAGVACVGGLLLHACSSLAGAAWGDWWMCSEMFSFYWFFFFFLMRQGKFSNTSCCQNRRRISSDHLLLPTVSFAWLLGALWKLLQLTELTEGKLNSFLPSWRLPWRVRSAVDWAEGMEWCEAGEGGTKPLCFRTLASWLHLNLQCGICRGEHSEARGSAAL